MGRVSSAERRPNPVLNMGREGFLAGRLRESGPVLLMLGD